MVSFGTGFWGPIVATGAMIVGVIVSWLIVSGSHRTAPQDPTDEKRTTYACGEELDVDETRPNSEMFFSPIRELFKGFYDYIRPAHSGDLNTYLVWVVWGTVIVLVLIGIVLWV